MRNWLKSYYFNAIVIVTLFSFLAAACQSPPPKVENGSPIPTVTVPAIQSQTDAAVTTENPVPTNSAEGDGTPFSNIVPAAGNPPSRPIVGIEFPTKDARNAQLAADLGAHWLRRNALLWSDVELLPGVREWEKEASLEAELKAASSQGLQVILIVRSAPLWAQKYPGVYCGPVKVEQLYAFANFMKEVVVRYSVPPYNVKYWELGNEPDVDYRQVSPDSEFGCWGNHDDPDFGGGYYAEMLKAVYPQIKSVDPQAHVLVGGLLLECNPDNPPINAAGQAKDCSAGRFLEGILKAGGQGYFDGISFHSYDFFSKNLGLGAYGSGNWFNTWNTTGPVLFAKTSFLRNLLNQYQATDKELLDTELALLCPSQNIQDCDTQDFNLTKAYYAAQAYAVSQVQGLTATVWYSNPLWRSSGLFDQQGQPLPAYQAIKVSAQAIGQATFVKEIDQYPGVKAYEFQSDNKRLWILWSLDGEDHIVSFPQKPASAYDVFGESLPIADHLTIGLKPVYLEWQATQ
jgi:hypothetical protein